VRRWLLRQRLTTTIIPPRPDSDYVIGIDSFQCRTCRHARCEVAFLDEQVKEDDTDEMMWTSACHPTKSWIDAGDTKWEGRQCNYTAHGREKTGTVVSFI